MKIQVKDLQNNMMGIYKINFPNGKIYVGLSVDIKRRMWEHNNLFNNKTPCDKAINKYGKITEIEILEFINDRNILGEREQYWIQKLQSNKKEKGYNLTIGGEMSQLTGENNPVATFSNKEVLDIRKRRYNGERKRDVYKDYNNHPFGTFESIWLGRGYPEIGKEFLIKTNSKSRQEYSSIANSGVKNGRAKCNEDDVRKIRELFDNGMTFAEINKLYPSLSKSTVRRIALKESYKNIK